MPILYARSLDDGVLQFDVRELAYFFGKQRYTVPLDQGKSIEYVEGLVLGRDRWFLGEFEVYDAAGVMTREEMRERLPASMSFPLPPFRKPLADDPKRSPPLRDATGRPLINPYAGLISETIRYQFQPKSLFGEIRAVDATQWLFDNLGGVPERARWAVAAGAELPPDDPEPEPIDVAEVALALRMKHPKSALMPQLVEFLAGKKGSASVADVAENVHGDANASTQAVRQNAERTSEALRGLGYSLSYRVTGGYVYRKVEPHEP